jgi:hypothetical protein
MAVADRVDLRLLDQRKQVVKLEYEATSRSEPSGVCRERSLQIRLMCQCVDVDDQVCCQVGVARH